jgi:hypothetical protein
LFDPLQYVHWLQQAWPDRDGGPPSAVRSRSPFWVVLKTLPSRTRSTAVRAEVQTSTDGVGLATDLQAELIAQIRAKRYHRWQAPDYLMFRGHPPGAEGEVQVDHGWQGFMSVSPPE